jgi:hypothetical protein
MTATIATRPDVALRRDSHHELEEIQAPEMFSFSAPGDCVAGILLSIDKVVVRGKMVTQYLVRLENSDKRVRFLATFDLSQKLQLKHVGRFIEVTFTGENKEVKKGDNYLREFRVRVAKVQDAAAHNNSVISDEDIPF